jgi:hypothetical protein
MEKRMAAEERLEPRPLWVRVVTREATKRPAAQVQACIFAFIACIGLLTAAIESASTSILGALAMPLGLAGACLGAVGAIWCWLAVRWVDRNGKWA